MRTRQRGQSMTEYLVVLGVTGTVLVATMADVSNIFDNVQDGYAAQSREVNRIQLYDSQRVRYSETTPGEDFDDGSIDPTQPELELPEPNLDTALFDNLGNLIGTRDGDKFVDEHGKTVATCDLNGLCVDTEGNSVTPSPIGKDGKALALHALYDEQGNMLGFAYYTGGGYYHPTSYRSISPPGRVTAELANAIYVGTGKQPAGYESRGKIYGLGGLYIAEPAVGSVNPNAEQLLTVNYTTPPSGWENLSPCVVMSNAQMADLNSITLGGASVPVSTLGDSGKQALQKPETLRYVKTTAAACNSSKQVTLYPGNHWVVSNK